VRHTLTQYSGEVKKPIKGAEQEMIHVMPDVGLGLGLGLGLRFGLDLSRLVWGGVGARVREG